MKEENKKRATSKKKEDKIEEEPKEKVKTTRKRVSKKKEKDIEIVKKSVSFNLIEVIFIVLITGIAVSIASGLIIYNSYNKDEKVSEKASIPKELNEFVNNYNKILNNYVEEVDKEELINAAIAGMYNYLGDDYSMYLNSSDTSDLEEQLIGEYEGVGIEIRTVVEEDNQYVIINRIFDNSPAQKAGLKQGDIITKVDGVEVNDSQVVADTIKKGNKESYEITYIRDKKEYNVVLKRQKVFINSVTSEIYDNVCYIKVDTFSATTVSQVTKILDSLDKKVTSLVVDVRNNTGGYLDTAYNLSNLFVEKGKVIYQIKNRDGKAKKYKADSGIYRNFDKIVVLINETSASASEIFALALKESSNATIVGVKSYGKGSVQETGHLSNGGMVKYTISYWLSPNGNSINKLGIKPDIEVTDEEKQLEKAIEVAK